MYFVDERGETVPAINHQRNFRSYIALEISSEYFARMGYKIMRNDEGFPEGIDWDIATQGPEPHSYEEIYAFMRRVNRVVEEEFNNCLEDDIQRRLEQRHPPRQTANVTFISNPATIGVWDNEYYYEVQAVGRQLGRTAVARNVGQMIDHALLMQGEIIEEPHPEPQRARPARPFQRRFEIPGNHRRRR